MTDEKNRTAPLPGRLSGPPDFRGRETRDPEPDVGKLPALPYYQRHPEHAPRRPLWRRSIRRRLMESA